ncbi:MAG: hypothetical protein RL070_1443 [Bacteroidota bacterium]|jgi:hypothetical protein
MKKCLLLLVILVSFSFTYAQDPAKKKLVFNPNNPTYEVEATCGTCMFKMEGKGCLLAIKFKGKNYFVDGTGLEDHGDAHDKEGFCNAIKKAKVQGNVVKDRFEVSYFELIKK